MADDFQASSFSLTIFLTSRGVSRIGDFMLLIGINVWVLAATHSPAAVSVLWILPALAQLLVGPWAGSMTDRYEKRLFMMRVDLIRAGLIAIMAMSKSLWCLYLMLFLVNGAGTFFATASAPYLTVLIPASRRKQINAINGTLQSSAVVVGPALTGLIVHATGSVRLALWIDAGTFFASALSLLFLPKLQVGTKTPSSPETQKAQVVRLWLSDLREALGLLKQRVIFTVVFSLVSMMGVLGAATDSQEVVFARQILDLSSSQYSFLVTIAGLGYILGALFVSVMAKRFSLRALMGFGSILMSCGFLLYAFSHSFALAAIGFILLGVFQSLSNAGFSTFFQSSLPPEYMGRVSNVSTPIRQMLMIVFMIGAGLLASSIGVRWMTIGFTTVMLLVGAMIFITVWSPSGSRTFRLIEADLSQVHQTNG